MGKPWENGDFYHPKSIEKWKILDGKNDDFRPYDQIFLWLFQWPFLWYVDGLPEIKVTYGLGSWARHLGMILVSGSLQNGQLVLQVLDLRATGLFSQRWLRILREEFLDSLIFLSQWIIDLHLPHHLALSKLCTKIVGMSHLRVFVLPLQCQNRSMEDLPHANLCCLLTHLLAVLFSVPKAEENPTLLSKNYRSREGGWFIENTCVVSIYTKYIYI